MSHILFASPFVTVSSLLNRDENEHTLDGFFVGADHRRLLPLVALGGGTYLILVDLLGRTLVAPGELPVGIVTAVLGGPFFLWLLLQRRKER